MLHTEGYIPLPDGFRLFYRTLGNGPEAIIPNGFYWIDDFRQLADSRKLIVYDVRNRGFSDEITDRNKLTAGINNDVQDLEQVRQFFNLDEVDLIGHSYMGLMVALYALKYPESVRSILQIGPSQPDARVQYRSQDPDSVTSEVFSRLAEIAKESDIQDPVERCRKFWDVLRRIYVFEAENAEKIHWDRCDLQNERNFMKYWTACILPSLQQIQLTKSDLSPVRCPVLIVHGNQDRSAPYEGARDWARMLPNARLLTIPNVGHAPWIEAPEFFYAAVHTFLTGAWPESVEKLS